MVFINYIYMFKKIIILLIYFNNKIKYIKLNDNKTHSCLHVDIISRLCDLR